MDAARHDHAALVHVRPGREMSREEREGTPGDMLERNAVVEIQAHVAREGALDNEPFGGPPTARSRPRRWRDQGGDHFIHSPEHVEVEHDHPRAGAEPAGPQDYTRG